MFCVAGNRAKNTQKGEVCINKQCENKIKENVDLYSDYSLEKAESGNTTYKQHKNVFISNGLSRTEAVINAVASRLVVHKDSKIKRFISVRQ